MTNFFKMITKDSDVYVADDEKSSSEFTGTIDTGSYILNALLSGSMYGGIPNNKITGFAGESATGKTYFALGIVRQYLIDNPEGAVFYIDTEAAVTKSMMGDRGIDTSRVYIVEPSTVQQFRHKVLTIIERYEASEEKPPILFVLDSLGQLSTSKELEDTASGSETKDMTRAAIIKATFRVLGLRLAKNKIPLLVTNHVYATMSMYGGNEISGGSGLKYTASTIVELGKAKEKDGTDIVGSLIRCKLYKSRLTKENKQIRVKLLYTTGLDRYYGLMELAEKYDVFPKQGKRFMTADGSLKFRTQIEKDPEKYFTPEIMELLEEAAGKEFKYGGAGDDAEVEGEELDDE